MGMSGRRESQIREAIPRAKASGTLARKSTARELKSAVTDPPQIVYFPFCMASIISCPPGNAARVFLINRIQSFLKILFASGIELADDGTSDLSFLGLFLDLVAVNLPGLKGGLMAGFGHQLLDESGERDWKKVSLITISMGKYLCLLSVKYLATSKCFCVS